MGITPVSVTIFSYVFLDKQGSTTISLKRYPTTCWITMEWVSACCRVCTISTWHNHAHVSSRAVPPDTFGKKPPRLLLMFTLFLKVLNCFVVSMYTSNNFPAQCPVLVLPTSGCRNLRLDVCNKKKTIS